MFGVPWQGDIIAPPDVGGLSTTLSTRLIVSQMNRFFSLASADLVVPNMEAWALLWDFETLRQLVDSVPGNTPYVVLVSCCQVHYQLTLL